MFENLVAACTCLPGYMQRLVNNKSTILIPPSYYFSIIKVY